MNKVLSKQKIAVFASFSGQGGVERMLVNLCSGLAGRQIQVDLVLVKDRSECLQDLPGSVQIIRLGTRHTFSSIFSLAAYIRRERPAAILAAKDRAGRTAIAARFLSGAPVRIVFRLGTTLSAALEGKFAWRKYLWYLPMRWIYPRADGIVAVSHGVAEDLAKITRMHLDRFSVIPNPVITPEMTERASEDPEHPWLKSRDVPIVIGMGRLTRQKDFPTLLRAFSIVRREIPSRLIILGEGGDRSILEALADTLGIGEDVDFPGFARNPYSYLQRADLFVLSSAWEGSPNSLTEALALGTSVVSTDCPSGPREILQEGRIAPLVAVGDFEALGKAMMEILRNPPDSECLRKAAEAYTAEESSRRYLDLLLGSVEESVQERTLAC